jgi:menaquinone-dependent protoporphyrinogen oxidase
MEHKVLVTYASKYGATAGIAEKIGEVLKQSGIAVDVVPAKDVNDVTPYTAVVLGSASYIGRWRKEAVKFLESQEGPLSGRPLWIFSSGPTGEGDPVQLMQGWLYPKTLQPVLDRIKPREITAFHGAIDAGKLNFLERTAIKNVKAPLGDFRDWNAISDWASGIARSLKEQTG